MRGTRARGPTGRPPIDVRLRASERIVIEGGYLSLSGHMKVGPLGDPAEMISLRVLKHDLFQIVGV